MALSENWRRTKVYQPNNSGWPQQLVKTELYLGQGPPGSRRSQISKLLIIQKPIKLLTGHIRVLKISWKVNKSFLMKSSAISCPVCLGPVDGKSPSVFLERVCEELWLCCLISIEVFLLNFLEWCHREGAYVGLVRGPRIILQVFKGENLRGTLNLYHLKYTYDSEEAVQRMVGKSFLVFFAGLFVFN